MEKLLAVVTKQLQEEYPEAKPLLGYTFGRTITNDPVLKHTHGLITLTFIKDGKEVCYALNRSSLQSLDDEAEEDLKWIEESLMRSFVNNLLFALGSMDITNLVSGECEPEEHQLLYTPT